MFVLLVIVNVLVFLHESNLGPAALRQFVWKYAFIPSKMGFTGSSMVVRAPTDLIQKIASMVTSQFLHAGSMHLLSNMVVLLFLGKKVEERIGSLKFLAFYLASGIAGNTVYAAFHLSSHQPVLGASGAVAGVLAASLLWVRLNNSWVKYDRTSRRTRSWFSGVFACQKLQEFATGCVIRHIMSQVSFIIGIQKREQRAIFIVDIVQDQLSWR